MVIEKLEEDGFISRNWALERFCSRLGALILALKKEGWVFTQEYTETPRGKDYTYTLISKPNQPTRESWDNLFKQHAL